MDLKRTTSTTVEIPIRTYEELRKGLSEALAEAERDGAKLEELSIYTLHMGDEEGSDPKGVRVYWDKPSADGFEQI